MSRCVGLMWTTRQLHGSVVPLRTMLHFPTRKSIPRVVSGLTVVLGWLPTKDPQNEDHVGLSAAP